MTVTVIAMRRKEVMQMRSNRYSGKQDGVRRYGTSFVFFKVYVAQHIATHQVRQNKGTARHYTEVAVQCTIDACLLQPY